MAKIDPTFIDRFGASVDALYYDIAHSSNGNSGAIVSDSIFFPMSRHKSWFPIIYKINGGSKQFQFLLFLLAFHTFTLKLLEPEKKDIPSG